jgi:hypothetical protein
MTRYTSHEAELLDRASEIARTSKPANYDTPEGELFRSALAMIEDERDWCGTGHGRIVEPNGHVQICSIIALYKANGCEDGGPYPGVRDALNQFTQRARGCGGIIGFNDGHSHAEVIAKWREVGHAKGWL